MVAHIPSLSLHWPSNLKHRIAPAGGIVAGGVVAFVALTIPTGTLEDWVWSSGIAAVVPVAQPPLGTTARAILALGGGLLAAAVTWSGLFLLFGPGGLIETLTARRKTVPAAPTEDAAVAPVAVVAFDPRATQRPPTVRRADAHPDAPARRPLSAKDLGVPMPPIAPVPTPMPAPAEQTLPVDLDQPLAAFDPAALPDAPRTPAPLVAPLRAPALAKGERIASVELPRTPSTDADAPSIETLLRRLERGTRRPQRAASR